MALLRVGMAELKVGGKGDTLQALGLGSCIGLVMFDKLSHIGGMVHVMLPDSEVSHGKPFPIGKFADTGVPELYKQVLDKGAKRTQLVVKMAGGAEMFAFAGKDSPKLAVGKRNAEAVRVELKKLGLHLRGENCGGSHGRSVEVRLEDLNCTVRVVGKEDVPL